MAKLTLTDLANLQNENTAVSAINSNNTLVENALENTLSRDGTSPNSMNATLDMNSHLIINLPDPGSATEPVTKGWADSHFAPESSGYAADAAASAAAALASEVSAAADAVSTAADAVSTAADAVSTAADVVSTAASAAAAAVSETNAAASAATAASVSAIPCTATYALNAGYGEFTLTPTITVASVAAGDRFRFKIPTGLSRTGAFKIKIDTVTSMALLRDPEDTQYPQYDDIVQGEYITVRAKTNSGTLWILDGPLMDRQQMWFPHGTVKLQCSGPSTLSLTQEDGKGVLIYDNTLGRFVNKTFGVKTLSNVFAASNYVGGTASQAYAANTLYHIYAWDNAGTVDLDAYPAVVAAAEGWTPLVNDISIYVKPTAAAGGTADNTRTFVGTLWTGSSDITTNLSGAAITLPCSSHFKVWRFPFHTDVNSVTGFTSTSYVTQTTPSCLIVTEGISDTGYFTLYGNYSNTTAGSIASMRITVTGVAFNGTTFSATSNPAVSTTPVNNYTTNMTCSWGVAVPRGKYVIKPDIKVSGGTAAFDLWMTGYVAN